MPVHTPVTTRGIYFITFTCFRWQPLIQLTSGYDLVYNWFDVLSWKGHAITGYVIMLNHLHILLYYSGRGSSLNTVVGNGKRFMAYAIVNRLNRRREISLLALMSHAVRASDRERGKKNEVWKESFDVKPYRTENFTLQKLHYIHNNSCAGKWRLAVTSFDYLHSSASFYISGKPGVYRVRDYREFLRLEVSEE